MKKLLTYIIVLFLFILSDNIVASDSCIYGKIIDKETKRPISDVNIYLANTTIGTTLNAKGYFEI